jgi:hypothetical protein
MDTMSLKTKTSRMGALGVAGMLLTGCTFSTQFTTSQPGGESGPQATSSTAGGDPAPAGGASGDPAGSPANAGKDAEWTKQCFADYEDFRQKWGPVEAKAREALKGIGDDDFYEAYPKLRALYLGLTESSKKLELQSGVARKMASFDGVGLEVLVAIAKLQRKHDVTYSRFIEFPQARRGILPTGDATHDRNHFCSRAYNIGTHRSEYKKRDWGEHTIHAPWLSTPVYEPFFKKEKELRTQAMEATKTKVDQGDLSVKSGAISGMAKKGDGHVVLTVRQLRQITTCVPTGRIERIHSDGSVKYETRCTTPKRAEFINTVIADFEEDRLVKGIRVGDQMAFVEKTIDRTGSGTAMKIRVEGRRVLNLYRGGKALGDWNLYDRSGLPKQ